MLASMSEIDPRADAPLVDWSDLGVSGLLPTGTVTLLLADVEGSTRLWETQPERDDRGLRAPGSRAVVIWLPPMAGCGRSSRVRATALWSRSPARPTRWRAALELQRAPLAPIRLRIGVHTGEVQLRDEGNYIGPTINRTARLRDLAHGGQTVLSGTTEASGRRWAAGRRVADRSGHSRAARCAAPRAGGAAVPSRSAQRVPAAAHRQQPLSAHNLPVAAHQLCRPRRTDDRRAEAARRTTGW